MAARAALAKRGRELLDAHAPINTPDDARAVMTALSQRAPTTLEDQVALARSLEVLSPATRANDLVTALRRRAYPDHPVFMPLSRDDVKPLTPEAQTLLDSVPFGTQDVALPGAPGRTADIAHAYVGFDAASNGMPVKARVYTYVGDEMQELASKVGIDAGGDANVSDLRGNDWGFLMRDAQKAKPNAPLSELITTTAPKITR